jgi:ferredoxin
VCPEIFELKDGKKASIVKDYRTKNLSEGEIKDNLISRIEEAIEVCPVAVIIIE